MWGNEAGTHMTHLLLKLTAGFYGSSHCLRLVGASNYGLNTVKKVVAVM